MNKSILIIFLFIASIIIFGCNKKVKSNTNKQQIVQSNSQKEHPIVFHKADTIEKTLTLIDSHKKKLFLQKREAQKKIDALPNTNSTLLKKKLFESHSNYTKRLIQGQLIIEEITKEYCYSTKQKLKELRDMLFESENFEIILSKCKSYSQKYSFTIKHFDYQNDDTKIELSIKNDNEKFLYENWDIIQKRIIHSIDVGDKIIMRKITFIEPSSNFYYHLEFNLMRSFHCMYGNMDNRVVSLNSDSNYLAIWQSNDLNIVGLGKKGSYLKLKYKEISKAENCNTLFSKDSKYVICQFIGDDSREPFYIVYNILEERRVLDFRFIGKMCFSDTGNYLFTLDESRLISSDKKYYINKLRYNINVCRSSIPSVSKQLRILDKGFLGDHVEFLGNYQSSNDYNDSNTTSETELDKYRKKKFLNSSVYDIDSRGTGLSMEELEWLYQEAKKQGYCD